MNKIYISANFGTILYFSLVACATLATYMFFTPLLKFFSCIMTFFHFIFAALSRISGLWWRSTP